MNLTRHNAINNFREIKGLRRLGEEIGANEKKNQEQINRDCIRRTLNENGNRLFRLNCFCLSGFSSKVNGFAVRSILS